MGLLLDEKDKKITRLKTLLNINWTNTGIPTSQTPINKKKTVPNPREKSNKKIGKIYKNELSYRFVPIKKEIILLNINAVY